MTRWFTLRNLVFLAVLVLVALYCCAMLVVEPIVNEQLLLLKSQIDGEVSTGEVRLAFLPLSVYIDDIKIKRGDAEIFTCQKLSLRFSLSLWSMTVKPEQAILYRPALQIVQKSDGRNNLDGLFNNSEKSSNPTPAIIVRHGLLSFSSPFLPKKVTVSSLTMNVEELKGRIHFDLKGQPEFDEMQSFARSCSLKGNLTSLKDIEISINLKEFWLNELPTEFSHGVTHSRPLDLTGTYARSGEEILVSAREDKGECVLNIPGFNQPLSVAGLSLDMKRLLPKSYVGALRAKICDGTLALSPKANGTFGVIGESIDAKALTEFIALPGFSLAGPLQIEGEISLRDSDFKANVSSNNLRFFYQPDADKYLGTFSNFGVQICASSQLVNLEEIKGKLNDAIDISGTGHYQQSGDKSSHFALQLDNVTISALEEVAGGRSLISSEIPLPIDPMRVKVFVDRSKSSATDKFIISAKDTRLKARKGTLPLRSGFCQVISDRDSDTIGLSTKLVMDEEAVIDLQGKFANGGGSVAIKGTDVHCAALAKLVPWNNIIGAGRVDAKGEFDWQKESYKANFALSIKEKAFLKIPRSLFEEDEDGLFRANLGPSKAIINVVANKDELTLNVEDALATFGHGGRLSLSAKYEKRGSNKKADVDFKMADISLPTLLDFVDVDNVEAKGSGTVSGNLLYDEKTTRLHCRASFPGAELYSFPFSKFACEFIYLEDSKGKRLELKSLNALTHNDGKIIASGTNVLAPIVKPDIRFLLENIDAKRLCMLAGSQDFSGRGRLRAEGLLEGTLWRPKIKMLVKSPKLNTYFKAGGKGFQHTLSNLSVSTWLLKSKGGWRLEVSKATAGALGGTLYCSGPLQLSPKPSAGLNITLKNGDGKELAKYLAIEDFSLAGDLSSEGVLKGPLNDVSLKTRVVLKNARLFYKLDGFNILYEPASIATNMQLEKSRILLNDTRGTYHGGAFVMDLARYSGKRAQWEGTVKFHAVDLHEFFKEQLKQKNDIRGLAYVQGTFKGYEGDGSSFSGMGNFSVKKGKIIELAELRRVESEYKLRNLIGIAFDDLRSEVKLVKSRLVFYDIIVNSTRGNGRGKVGVSFNKKLDGTLSVSLDRSVLSKGHRLLSLIEGGHYFDFKVHLSGTTDDPNYNFSSRGVKNGAIIGGAALFTPLAPAAVIYTGIKKLFGRKR